ncbi:unnamed protein product [Ambrosiozyma monospora]|uniref:Unnamed protein product n=1 Tax=Ambrosiozyma monospora TaxID=43982 RepID=A0A9W6Z5R6_AMBMO|nr:unnamed protein product [Ambrosiozyma monospora]
MIMNPVKKYGVRLLDTNNLVKDKENWATRITTDLIDTFTEAEHEKFCEAFALWPKKFGKISHFMGGLRTPEECVLHYYRTKKRTNYKHIVANRNKRTTRKAAANKRKAKAEAVAAATAKRLGNSGTHTPESTPTPGGESEVDYSSDATNAQTTPAATGGNKRKKASNGGNSKKRKTASANSATASATTVTTESSVNSGVATPDPHPSSSSTQQSSSVGTATATATAVLPPVSSSSVNISFDTSNSNHISVPVTIHTHVPTVSLSSSTPVSQGLQSIAAQHPQKTQLPPQPQQLQQPQPLSVSKVQTHVGQPEKKKTKRGRRKQSAVVSAPDTSKSEVLTTINSVSASASVSASTGNEEEKKNLKDRSHITSYWSVQESTMFPVLLEKFGSDWESIAKQIGSKSATMVRNYFQRGLSENSKWETILKATDLQSSRWYI